MRIIVKIIAWAVGLLLLVAVLLWGTTRFMVYRAEQKFPDLGQITRVENVPIHYVSQGTGTPVVLIHGNFESSHDFGATILPALAQHHRVIAVDRPGHGYSGRPGSEVIPPDRQAEMLHRLLQQVQPGPVTLVGFSYGGTVALAYALAYPQDVRSLVILSGTAYPFPLDMGAAIDWFGKPGIGDVLRQTLGMPMGLLVAAKDANNVFAPEPVPAAYGNAAFALALRPDNFKANIEDMQGMNDFLRKQCPHYGELHMPTMIVTGTGDIRVDPKLHALPLHAAISGSTLVELPGAGHMILYARTAEVVAAIEQADTMAGARKR